MKPWTEKHFPKSCKEVKGNDKAIDKLKEIIKNKKMALIYGATGIGKTCSVYALANDLNCEILEFNASHLRNKEQINSILGSALKQQSLFGKEKIILIEEIDGIAGREDYGGIQALSRLLKDNDHAIILTANNPFDAKLSSLRNKVELIEFQNLDYSTIYNVLSKICKNEKIKFKDEDLKVLSRRAGGDLRAAINDLQGLAEHKKELKKEDLELIGDRDKKESIFNALKLILKSKNVEEILRSLDKLDMDLDESFLWLDENIPREYKGYDLVRAYDALSKSDVFNGRIRKLQYYRFLVYRNNLMTAGVALAKKEKYVNWTSYKRTSRIFKLWMAKQKNVRKKAIALKIAKKTHSSVKKVLRDTLPYLQNIFKKNEDLAVELNLSEEEIEWLKR